MKVEQSELDLTTRHALKKESRLEANYSFRSILKEIEASPPPDASRDKVKAEERVRLMLQQLIAAIMAALSGEKCRCDTDEIAALQGESGDAPSGGGANVRRFEWERTVVEHVSESESTAFSGKGSVRTADGRTLDFDLSLSMCRNYECTREIREQGAIELKDPLVINFSGKAAELSGKRIAFDLDADGAAEQVPELAAGSGYLCFDADRDGRIGDGRELFGATGAFRGEGFADLARLDADRNGWIDETDPAFAALGIWFPDGRIQPLKDAGVGALGLSNAWSPFALRDGDNAPLGQIWRTGVFLHEDGRAGTLQQIDLAVQQSGSDAAGEERRG